MEEQLQHGTHETSDAELRPIVLAGAALAITVVIVGVVGFGMMKYLEATIVPTLRPNPMALGETSLPPGPRVEEHPAIALQQLRAQEDHALSTYGWVNKTTGVVRIPIDRAIELQLERGFPVREVPKK